MPVRAAVFSYFELADLTRLMDAISSSGMPAETRVHIGTYGVNREASITVHTYGPGRYSPIFKAEIRTEAWDQRTLTPEEERKVGPRFAGRVPDEAVLLGLSTAQRTSWGMEVGRRYRDTLRHSRAAGITVDSWQLDELGTQLAGPQGRQHREFVRGVLQGITFGRRVLGDTEGKGFVWATRRALNLARLPLTTELRAFWQQLDRAAFRVAGEEFPNFVGDPARAARTQADGQHALVAGGPVRRALAGRYVAGMTPGYRIGHGLGGNVNGLSRAEVNRWRNSYVAERNRIGVAGFGEFHFVLENSRTFVMVDAARAVARGMAGL
ncbi:MAG TPA: hypothetical protein VKC65_00025 [Gaiellaceae bacterium]|nr:hypothetical protein [Gaiellaceae bacterium]